MFDPPARSPAGSRRVVVVVVAAAVVVVVGVVLLSLAILFALHSSILKPDLDLTFGKIKVAGQFPSFLLRHVGIEKKLFL